jgi:CRISPR/Cas system-associated exonuclease Cas4 (RecB family)
MHLGINPQLFNYLEDLFLTQGPYDHQPIEHVEKNIINLPILGLWGIHGLIGNYNIQDALWQKYNGTQLMMISHLIANHLMVNMLQWVGSYNPIYYYPYKKYFNNYCHYQYHKTIIHWQTKKNWQKYPHSIPLKVGQKINGGPLGHFHWKYENCKTIKHLSMDIE